MSAKTGPDIPPATAALVGLPADGLAHLLDSALGEETAPAPEPPPADLPPAFAKDGSPYSLDDLLSGLEPVVDEADRHLEPALLLAEMAPVAPMPASGWLAPAPSTVLPPPTLEDDLRQVGGDGPVEAVLHMAAAESMPSEADETTAALASIASALETLARQEPEDAAETAPAEKAETDDDVLVLTDDFLAIDAPVPEVPVPEVLPDETTSALASMLASLQALSQDGAPVDTAPPAEDDDDVILLTEDYLPPDAPPEPEPEPEAEAVAEPEPEPEPEPAVADTALAEEMRGRIEALIAAYLPDGMAPEPKGDPALPARLDALALLLSDPPPAGDFAALDALYACWPRATQDSDSRALLAVAHNLSRNFGLPGKLPMASAKAWHMLSPRVFEAELARRLADVGTFIAEWQKTQRIFLILEFSEIELIEYLFEALHPGYHAQALAEVMNFKVLSNRRMGLLRRIPVRVKKQIAPLLPDNKEQALVDLAHVKALLEQVAAATGFAPIAEAAAKAQEEVEKTMKAVANMGAPPSAPGGGLALGRIG